MHISKMISRIEKISQSEHSFQLTSLWWLCGGCWCSCETLHAQGIYKMHIVKKHCM